MDIKNYCSSPFCMGGGYCPGCKNGKLDCNDKECSPYCRGCELPKGHEELANIIFGVIFGLLLIICFSLLIALGPRFVIFHDGDRNKPRQPDNTLFD